MKTIYVLGSHLIEEDSLPLKLLPKLKKEFENISFKHLDPTEEIPEEEDLVLIDTIINTKEIKILREKDLDKIENPPDYSLHDFDLAMNLKIIKKLGRIKRFTILGLPPDMEEDRALNEIRNHLQLTFKK